MTDRQTQRLKKYPLHESQKGYFARELYEQMCNNENIYLLVGDLGFGMFDPHFQDITERCINTGASEQSLIGIATGLALENKIPFVYSVTNFILYRPFEWIRNYLDHENIPVKLIGAGRNDEYDHDGYTHQCKDAKYILDIFPNIVQFWPTDKNQIKEMLTEMISNHKPSFISLQRKA
jgi:transketolase